MAGPGSFAEERGSLDYDCTKDFRDKISFLPAIIGDELSLSGRVEMIN